jgi:CRP-like cAMP-binding protein
MSTMARNDPYLEHLGAVRLLSSCTKAELRKVASASIELELPAGRALVKEGTAGRECFIVVGGTATVKRNGRKIGTLGPGDAVGELSLLDRGPRTATVVADTPMTVLVLGPRELGGLIDDAPDLTRKLLEALAGRVRELDKTAYG